MFRSLYKSGLPLLLCLTSALGACGPDPAQWSQTPTDQQKVARATPARALHGVTFAPGSTYLSGDEQVRLAAFARQQIRYGDEVVLLADDGGGYLQQARLATVRAALQGQGVTVAAASRTGEIATGGDAVLVAATRWVARGPACPDWSKSTTYDPNNTSFSNFGCADAQNLGTMVANPRDLEQGRDPGPQDGGRAAAAVERYRRDAVKQIVVQTTGSGAPGAAAAPSSAGAAVGTTAN